MQRVVDIRLEGTEVTVVDTIHVRSQFGVLRICLRVHLQQYLQSDLMSLGDIVAALLFGQTGGDQQDGRGTGETGLIDLVVVDNEVLIQDRDVDL